MKQLYLFLFFILSLVSSTKAQSELLEGTWVLDSIFDADILLENPSNPISINISNLNNSILVNSFCGSTYESFFTASTTENTIDINQTSWNYSNCSEDTQGWEGSISLLLSNPDVNPTTLNYIVSQDEDTELLELGISYYWDENVITSTIGFFSRDVATDNSIIGEWYLNSQSIDGIIQHNTDYGDIHPRIEFTEIPFESGLRYDGIICNDYHGNYSVDETNNLLSFNSLTMTLGSCMNENPQTFENDYIFNFINDSSPLTVNYHIYGQGDNATLILTNTNNSNFAVFGKFPQPVDILGDWFLDYVVVDNNTYNNNYNDFSLFKLQITESIQGNGYFDFHGYGGCEAFFGYYTPNQNVMTINEVYFTLGGSCGYIAPAEQFESRYYSILETGQIPPFNLSYTIVGENENQSLTITNSFNGSIAVYSRTPNPEILNRTWYLSRIETPGNPNIEIPITDSPSITFTSEINPVTFRTTAAGTGECNTFTSDYEVTLNNGDNIQVLDFSPTLGPCDSSYENQYFDIISNLSTNYSEFEIINNGTILNITDLLGTKLVFGDEQLSVNETSFNILNISLKSNPVTDIMYLNSYHSLLNYEIFTLTGKLLKKEKLHTDSIDIKDFSSGLYFIRFSNDKGQTQVIKFIKQ